MRTVRGVPIPTGFARLVAGFAVVLLLAACNGGGGSDSLVSSPPGPVIAQNLALSTVGETTEPEAPPFSVLATDRTADTLRDCGNENELGCGLFERDLWNGTCDAGLHSSRERCGCLLHGLLGNCLIPQFCNLCRNDTRHRPETSALYASSWEHWALKNQREQLAVDEPLNWVMHLGTHNAFNTFSDGHQPRVLELTFPIADVIGDIADAPNQFYSMSTQLDLDSRMLAIDAHWVGGALGAAQNARLCHSLGTIILEDLICRSSSIDFDGDFFPAMRYFANGVKEIKNWLERHPDAILILNLENYVGCANCRDGDAAYISDPLRAHLGSLLTDSGVAGPAHDWILERTGEFEPPPPVSQGNRIDPLPSRAELLALGKRVIVIFNGDVGGEDDLNPAIGFPEATVVAGSYKAWLKNNQDFELCQDFRQGEGNFGPSNAGRGEFTVVVEDRTQQRWNISQTVQPERFPYGGFGELSVDDLRKVALCNYTIVATDFLGSALPLGRRFDTPDFSRHEALVWSWSPGDRGDNGDCAMVVGASGRWASADCTRPRHYACAPPRSESGTEDRSQWQQREFRWAVTEASGPWDGGPAACAAEFPSDADGGRKVFSVPVNGYQNKWLNAANAAGGDVWLNYTDQAKEGAWVIPKLANLNTPPVADAGPDQERECGGDTVLDGLASVDADGDPLTYAWTGPFGTLSGPVVTVRLGTGVNVITLRVEDGKGGVSSDSVSVTVSDNTPPSLWVALSPTELWPPNHQMVNVAAEVSAQDTCDAGDVLIALISIISSEPENGLGDGDTAPDIADAELGIGDLEFALRAERSGHGAGRVYDVIYSATDDAGNTTEASAAVRIPKSQR